MKVSLDKAEQDAPAWDLEIEVGGVSYPTREITFGELERLKNLPQLTVSDVRQLIAGLFADPKPDVSKWNHRQVMGAVAVVIKYFTEFFPGSGRAMTERARSMMNQQRSVK